MAKVLLASVWLLILLVDAASAQGGSWTTETVDKLSSRGISLAVDARGNLHLSYVTDEGDVKYAFRPTGSSRWFTMNIAKGIPYYGHGGGMFTRITVDEFGNPHFCFTAPPTYAHYLNGKWTVEQINSPGGAYACGIAVAPGGTIHMSWYQEKDGDVDYYLHLKYGILKDNVWVLKTIDFDKATGKWNQLVLDGNGMPHISYSAFISGQMKYATFNGKDWILEVVDNSSPGSGNSLALDKNGEPHLVYFNDRELKYARKVNGTWSIQSVAAIAPRGGAFEDFRSSIALDSHRLPHISYEDSGTVKYAAFDGTAWVKQNISPAGSEQILYNSIAIGPDDSIYVAYRDPLSGAVTVAAASRHPSTSLAQISVENHADSPTTGTSNQAKRNAVKAKLQ